MVLAYDEMIRPGIVLPAFFKSSPCDVKKNGSFIFFQPKDYSPAQDDRQYWWKYHISIHPDDLAIAWDIIYPILEKHAHSFKIIDKTDNEKKQKKQLNYLREAQLCLNELRQLLPDFENTKSPKASTPKTFLEAIDRAHAMKSLYPKGFPTERNKRAKTLQYHYFFAEKGSAEADSLLKRFYIEKYQIAVSYLESLIIECEACLKSVNRFQNGMQITIYIPPGKEEHYQLLAEHLSVSLHMNQIRPGLIHESDRELDRYLSLRHSGLGEYISGVDKKGYNPSGQKDVFQALIGIKTIKLTETLTEIIETLRTSPYSIREDITKITLQLFFQVRSLSKTINQIKDFKGKALMFSTYTLQRLETKILPLLTKARTHLITVSAGSNRHMWFNSEAESLLIDEDKTAPAQQLVLRPLGG